MSESAGARKNKQTKAESKVFIVPISSSFYLSYLSLFSEFYGLRCKADIQVLASLCSKADRSGTVLLPPSIRKEIEKQAEISAQTMTNSLARMRKLGLIIGDKGCFQIRKGLMWDKMPTGTEFKVTIEV